MRFRTLARSAVVLVPLLIACAGKIQSHRTVPPQRAMQDLNRCLTVMRVAASRRRSTRTPRAEPAAVPTDAGAAWARHPHARVRSA